MSSHSSSSTANPSARSTNSTRRASCRGLLASCEGQKLTPAAPAPRVEFGELRQFLRLDGSAPSPSVASQPAPAAASAAPSGGETTGAAASSSAAAAPKPSLDDFASLSLSPSELDELAREIASGSTFSSGLGSLSPPGGDGDSRAPLNFAHATRTIEPVLPPTAPLAFERVNFTRPLPDRPLASDAPRDELEGIETDGVGEDELEKLARELEAEEEEEERRRRAGAAVEPPPLPEKETDPNKAADPPVPPKLPAELAGATAVGGAGGAALSAPLVEVETLVLSPREAASLAVPPSPGGATLEVQPVSALERAAPLPTEGDEEASASSRDADGPRTTRREADEIKKELNLEGARGGAAKVSEMPHFAAGDLTPRAGVERAPATAAGQGPSDDLVDNVAAAIRGGDL